MPDATEPTNPQTTEDGVTTVTRALTAQGLFIDGLTDEIANVYSKPGGQDEDYLFTVTVTVTP